MKIREYMTLDADEIRCAIQNYVEDCGRHFVVEDGETKPKIMIGHQIVNGGVCLNATIEIEREQKQEVLDDDIPF